MSVVGLYIGTMTHAEVRKLFTTHKLSCPLSSLRANMTFCCAEVGLSTAKASGLQTQYIKHPLRVSPVILCTYRYCSNALQDVFVLTMNKSKARSRFSQNKCTICGEQCAKFNSFPCGNCVESTHSACVAMCEVNTRRFEEKNRVFYCPNCVATAKNVFHYKKSLDRYVDTSK
jgi:hypothetical protein